MALEDKKIRNTHHVFGERRSSVEMGSMACVVFTATIPTVRTSCDRVIRSPGPAYFSICICNCNKRRASRTRPMPNGSEKGVR